MIPERTGSVPAWFISCVEYLPRAHWSPGMVGRFIARHRRRRARSAQQRNTWRYREKVFNSGKTRSVCCKGNQAVSDGKTNLWSVVSLQHFALTALQLMNLRNIEQNYYDIPAAMSGQLDFGVNKACIDPVYLRLKVRSEAILSMILRRKGQLYYAESPHKHTRQESGKNSCFSDCKGEVKGRLRGPSFLREIQRNFWLQTVGAV